MYNSTDCQSSTTDFFQVTIYISADKKVKKNIDIYLQVNFHPGS